MAAPQLVDWCKGGKLQGGDIQHPAAIAPTPPIPVRVNGSGNVTTAVGQWCILQEVAQGVGGVAAAVAFTRRVD